MAIERIDNWEMVIYGKDLENGKIRLEDSETTCAIVREIGTDSAKTVSFGVEGITYIRINKLIAPYYKAQYNLNRMQFSKIRDGKWVTTGFELPIPIDSDIEISGLDPDKKIYLKGTLFKGVLEASHPINKYLIARKVEVPYKRLHPILFEDVTIPTTFTKNKKFILRTDGVSRPILEEWDAVNPHYTIAPDKDVRYVLNNPIEVLWDHEEIPPEGVEFRIWYDGTEDLKVTPRLDHMFLPPSDGKSRYTKEHMLIPTAQVRSLTLSADVHAGSNVTLKVNEAVTAGATVAVGQNVLIYESADKWEIAKVVAVNEGSAGSASIVVDRIEKNYSAGAKIFMPVAKLKYPPLEPVDVIVNPGGGLATVYTPTGEVFVTEGHDLEEFVFGYYAFRIGGGKDIFSMNVLPQKYRDLSHPHKLTFMFVNKYGNPTVEGRVTVYTLAILYRSVPPETAEQVSRTYAEARPFIEG